MLWRTTLQPAKLTQCWGWAVRFSSLPALWKHKARELKWQTLRHSDPWSITTFGIPSEVSVFWWGSSESSVAIASLTSLIFVLPKYGIWIESLMHLVHLNAHSSAAADPQGQEPTHPWRLQVIILTQHSQTYFVPSTQSYFPQVFVLQWHIVTVCNLAIILFLVITKAYSISEERELGKAVSASPLKWQISSILLNLSMLLLLMAQTP